MQPTMQPTNARCQPQCENSPIGYPSLSFFHLTHLHFTTPEHFKYLRNTFRKPTQRLHPDISRLDDPRSHEFSFLPNYRWRSFPLRMRINRERPLEPAKELKPPDNTPGKLLVDLPLLNLSLIFLSGIQ